MRAAVVVVFLLAANLTAASTSEQGYGLRGTGITKRNLVFRNYFRGSERDSAEHCEKHPSHKHCQDSSDEDSQFDNMGIVSSKFSTWGEHGKEAAATASERFKEKYDAINGTPTSEWTAQQKGIVAFVVIMSALVLGCCLWCVFCRNRQIDELDQQGQQQDDSGGGWWPFPAAAGGTNGKKSGRWWNKSSTTVGSTSTNGNESSAQTPAEKKKGGWSWNNKNRSNSNNNNSNSQQPSSESNSWGWW